MAGFSLFTYNKYNSTEKLVDVNTGSMNYLITKLGDVEVGNLTRLSNENAYKIATSVLEVFNPIDIIANRVSGVDYQLQDLNGNIVEPKGNLANILKKPNYSVKSLSDLIYQIVFYGLSTGNKYIYTPYQIGSKEPKDIDIERVMSLWALQPNLVSVKYKTSVPPITRATSFKSFVDYFTYDEDKERISPMFVNHQRVSPSIKPMSYYEGESPLMGAKRNIDNIIAVYAARYNVYKNNGMAGLLSRKTSNSNTLEEAANPVTKEDIVRDINDRHSIVDSSKNIYGVSSIPLEFIRTLASISELMPFEETLADASAIASLFQVDKDLINSKDNSNYENKKNAERSLWSNVIKQEAQDVCDLINSSLNLKDVKLVPNFDKVEVLMEDMSVKEDIISKKIDNYTKLKELGITYKDLISYEK